MQHMEDSQNHEYTPLDNSILCYYPFNTIDSFEDHYLRNVDVKRCDYLTPEVDALRNHHGSESEMHACVAKLLTKAGLLLCVDGRWPGFVAVSILTSVPRV